MPRITDAELQEWQELCSKATKEPWTTECRNPDSPDATLFSERDDQHHGMNLMVLSDGDWNYSPNVDFIAASRTALPRLIAAVRELRAVEKKVRQFAEVWNKWGLGWHNDKRAMWAVDKAAHLLLSALAELDKDGEDDKQ